MLARAAADTGWLAAYQATAGRKAETLTRQRSLPTRNHVQIPKATERMMILELNRG